MIKKALCIGNANYPGRNALKNPANDATDLANKLDILGFSCMVLTDADAKTMDEALQDFASSLCGAEVGLFFYAGHGMQIEGDNYLTAINSDFRTERNAKFSSLRLDKIIDILEKGDNATSIIILDACRDNPFEHLWGRGSKALGLAPVYAPKGTIIAFATSPGEIALDGTGSNGLFTGALLQHIDKQNVTIEDLFKRVRNTVSAATSGKQTSWEHTSLMGDFYFNLSSITGDYVAQYSSQAKADSRFRLTTGPLKEIIDGLKSHSWYGQNPPGSIHP